METNDFIKGALIGGVVGGVLALFVAPKAGSALRHDIAEGYEAVNDTIHGYVDEIKHRAHHLLNGKECSSPNYQSLMAGGLTGTLIGTLAGLLLAPQTGEKLRKKLGEEYDEIKDKAHDVVNGFSQTKDHLEDWKDTFLTILDKFNTPSKKNHQHSYFNHIVDLASIGLNLYNQAQKRR